jgi:hypothetical protein
MSADNGELAGVSNSPQCPQSFAKVNSSNFDIELKSN